GNWFPCRECPDTLGVIHGGDAFSGSATWDTGAPGVLLPGPVLSLEFIEDGLSFSRVGSVSNPVPISSVLFSHGPYQFQIDIPAHFRGAIVTLGATSFLGDPYFTTAPTPIPEPSTIGLLAGGLALMGLLRRCVRSRSDSPAPGATLAK